MPIALTREPDANTTAPMRPKTINEKYSAGPNLKATSARGAAKPANIKVATQPAKKEPTPAVKRATPPRPRLAI